MLGPARQAGAGCWSPITGRNRNTQGHPKLPACPKPCTVLFLPHSKANNQNSTTDKRVSSAHKDEHTWATSQSPMVHRNILLEKKDTAFNPQTESRPKIIRQESPIMCTFKSRHNPGHAFIKHGVFAKLIRGLFNHGLWVLGRWPSGCTACCRNLRTCI